MTWLQYANGKRWLAWLVFGGVAIGAAVAPVTFLANPVEIPARKILSIGTGCFEKLPDGTVRDLSPEEAHDLSLPGSRPVHFAWCGTKLDTPTRQPAYGDYWDEPGGRGAKFSHKVDFIPDAGKDGVEIDEKKGVFILTKPLVDILQADAAIALDRVTELNEVTSVSSSTFSHTVTAGSKTFLVVQVVNYGATRNTTGVTYNGDALTLADQGDGNNINASVWYLANPDVGTNNVIVTAVGTVSGMSAAAVSLYGVRETGQPDSTTSKTTYTSTGGTTMTSTVVDGGSWGFDAIGDQSAAMSPSSTQVATIDTCSGTCGASYRTNVSVGAFTMQWSWSGSDNGALAMATFAPYIYPSASLIVTGSSSVIVGPSSSIIIL